MTLNSLPVLIDPIIVLRLLHHWILSRKVVHQVQPSKQQQQQQQQKTAAAGKRPVLVRRELSLPADERVISRLEAQLLPHVNRFECPFVSFCLLTGVRIRRIDGDGQ